MKCAVAGVDMGTFNCPLGCEKRCKSDKIVKEKNNKCEENNTKRPNCCKLSQKIKKIREDNSNKCIGFFEVLDEAFSDSIEHEKSVSDVMEELKTILIGDGLTRKNRGTGPCFAGNFAGSEGLKSEYRDQSDQIQHAFAGVYIGYKYGKTVCKIVEVFHEDSKVDKKLYQATCPIGASLHDSNKPDWNYVVRQLKESIGDESCKGEIE